jgi:hypothetical protein
MTAFFKFMITYWIVVKIKMMHINILVRLKYLWTDSGRYLKTAQNSENEASQIKRTHIIHFTDSKLVYTGL